MSEDNTPANDPVDYFEGSEKRWLLQSVALGSGELVDILVEEGKIVKVEANIGAVGEVGLIAGRGRRVTPGKINMFGDQLEGEGEVEVEVEVEGVTLTMEQLPVTTGELQQKLADRQSQSARTNFGVALSLTDVQDLHSPEGEEAVSRGGVRLVSLWLNKLDNKQILAAFKRLASLGCLAQVWLDRSTVSGHLRRAGVTEICLEELEETEVRRVVTLARQVRLPLCVAQISSVSALNVIKQFSKAGCQVYAGVTDSLLAQVKENQELEDIIISLHPSSSIKMSATNPAKLLGLHPGKGSLEPGAEADLVIWSEDLSPDVVLLQGQVVQAAGQLSPRHHGVFRHLQTVRPSQEAGDVKRVERKEDIQRKEEMIRPVKIEPSLVSDVNQVPGIFQRRVSAFGIRNQQDSTFNLTQPDSREQEQPHSLTGSRRASVKVHAPPGGLSSGFW